ncbi:MAG: carbohydrate-binding family 9-like protein [Candidatus Latescibacterota bacterium]|nr:MAG: carbohydrate-binding family 9-like protein [Candidatus Latescibacterota bacterium]
MNKSKPTPLLIALLAGALLFLVTRGRASEDDPFPIPAIEWKPKTYVCYRTDKPLDIDGHVDEPSWAKAEWTDDFVDIEGSRQPSPRFRTRVKMLWDSTYFYVAAELEEPDVWATLVTHDTVIYYDNDFEVFIDPDGDTHEYYELEVNALDTEWDLLLLKPYRDGGPALHDWDIPGLKTAVYVDGTLNQPGDTDVGWTVEIAFPWTGLWEYAHGPTPPDSGDQWRVNFSRVEWQIEVIEDRYHKIADPDTGEPLDEDNWVWSPQGLIAMHYPEMWGFVQFSSRLVGTSRDTFEHRPIDAAGWALRQIYYAQKSWHAEHGGYAGNIDLLPVKDPGLEGFSWPPVLVIAPGGFKATFVDEEGESLSITQDGRLWSR